MNFMKLGGNKVVPLYHLGKKRPENPASGNQEEVVATKPNPPLASVGDDSTATSLETEELSFSSSRASLESFGSSGKEDSADDSDSSSGGGKPGRPVGDVEVEHIPVLSRSPPSPRSFGRKSFSVTPFPPPRASSLVARSKHRRTSSASPRLETVPEGRPAGAPEEKPPLPPRKYSQASSPRVHSGSATSAPASAPTSPVSGDTTARKSYGKKLPEYPAVPEKPPREGQHRRVLSAPSRQPEGFMDVPGLQRKLKQLQEQYGEEHTMVAPAWNWLGNAHFRQGNVEEALQAYKRAVICGPGEHLADAYANIGTCYWTTGNVEVAIPFLQFALSEHEYNAMAQGQDPNTSSAVAGVQYQLGLALTLHKDYEGALFSLNQSRAIRERLLGRNHMDVARTLDAMGKAYFLQGNHSAALDCHIQALAIKECLRDFSRSGINGTIMNIVEVHRGQNALAEAGVWMQRLLAAQKKEFLVVKTKDLCADIAVSLCVLGDIYDSAMQYAEGAVCYGEADLYFEKACVPTSDPRRAAVVSRLSK